MTSLAAAFDALEGLSVGDALGERFFVPHEKATAAVAARWLPPGPWYWTDDTLMAASVVEILFRRSGIAGADLDALAASFAARMDIRRGYGPAAGDLLLAVRAGGSWRELAPAQFDGSGSWGNGAAMRVAPLGAFYAGDLAAATVAARLQSSVTHTHPEAADGAVAVTVAAAVAAGSRGGPPPKFVELLQAAGSHAGDGRTAGGLEAALRLGPDVAVERAAQVLGVGWDIAAFDTVPFALWSAAVSPDDFEAVFWRTVAGLGDRDTTCAIACGVTAARLGRAGIPAAWLAAREPLPQWLPATS